MKRPFFLSCLLFLFCQTVIAKPETIETLLNYSLEDLMKIEIHSASKTDLTVGEIPASVIIIDRQEIKQYGYSTLEEVIANIPGMYLTEDWAWFGSVNYGVRGLYSKGHFDNMIILVNGVNQMEDGKRGYPLEKINVPVQAIDRIEVIRGPMSVIYGSSAFLGAINIITNLNGVNADDGIASFSKGDHGTQKIFARLSGKEGSISTTFNAQIYQTDGPSHFYRDLMSDTSALPSAWNLSEDAKTVLGNKSKYFDFSLAYKKIKMYFSHIAAEANVIDSQPGVGAGSVAFTEASNISVDYSKNINDDWRFKGKASFFYNHYFLNEEYNFTGFYSNNQSDTEAQEYELNFVWTPSASTESLFGIVHRLGKYRAYDDYPTFSLSNREIVVPETIRTYALFNQTKYKLREDLTIVGGIRAEWQGDYSLVVYDNNIDINNQNVSRRKVTYGDVSYIPKFAAIYDLGKNEHIKFMYSVGEKAPSPADSISLIDLSQPSLVPEKTRSTEISYILAKNDFFVQLGVFHNEVENLIISSAILDGGVFVSTLDNVGKLESNGLELNTTAKLTQAFKLNFDISLQRVKDKTPGYENIEAAYAPTTISNVRGTYNFYKTSHLSLLGHYVSSVLPEWKIASTGTTLEERIRNGVRTGDKIDGYASYDLNYVAENFYIKNLDLSLKIGNLTNVSKRYPTINNRVFDKGTIGLDRNYIATLAYVF